MDAAERMPLLYSWKKGKGTACRHKLVVFSEQHISHMILPVDRVQYAHSRTEHYIGKDVGLQASLETRKLWVLRAPARSPTLVSQLHRTTCQRWIRTEFP